MQKVTWQVAGLSDCGLVRSNNEDNYSISSDERVFVVADGMGGTANGGLASQLAVEEMEKYRAANRPDLSATGQLERWLCDSIAKANERVVAEQSKLQTQMGTTIVVAVQSDDGHLHIAHVGDSRAYLVRGGQSSALTIDHSVVMDMLRTGKLTKEQCKKSPFKHLITRCLGHETEVECDYMTVGVQPGDWIILASDGLEAVIDEQDLANILEHTDDPSHACSTLVDQTLAGGAPDNVTVLAIHYRPELAAITDQN